MNLNIDETYKSKLTEQIVAMNKINGNGEFKSYSDYQKELAEKDKKITEEEDAILYQLYKKSFFCHANNKTFEIFKSRLTVSFPPATAPGIVRKAWREMMEKATPEGKSIMQYFGDLCMIDFDRLSEGIMFREMPKDLNGYLDLIKYTKEYVIKCYDIPEVGKQVYEGLIDVASSLQTELEKY